MARDGARWSTIEKELRNTRGPLLAGVDEVGRGPLAGPVVACAVVMPADARAIRGVDDSKALSESFTVRKISNGVGVERIFPVHSPMLSEILVVRRGRVRRAKLYYLRHLTGKATRIREKKVRIGVPTTGAGTSET